MTRQELIDVFMDAKQRTIDVVLELTVPNATHADDYEYIVVISDNIYTKLVYYIENYTENLVLKRNANIRIVNAVAADFCDSEIGNKFFRASKEREI